MRDGVVLGAVLIVLAIASRARAAACGADVPVKDRAVVAAAASACAAAGQPAAAIALHRRRLAWAPGDRQTRAALAEQLAAADDLAGAEVEYDRLLAEADGLEPGLRKKMADVLAWRGKLDDAIREYRGLVALGPPDPAVLTALGLALGWQGRTAEADEVLQRAVATAPRDADAAKALAELRASPKWSAREAEIARRADREDPARWATSIEALIDAQQFSDAEERLATARDRWPNDGRWIALGARTRREKAAAAAARLDEAKAAVAARPTDGQARLALASALAGAGEFRAARAEYERHLRAHPDDVAVRLEMARVCSWQGDYGRSLALYDELLRARPHDADLAVERARVLSWDGQLTESAQAFQAASAGQPEAAARGLGDSYRWGGDLGTAAGYYTQAIHSGHGDDADEAENFFLTETRRHSVAPAFTIVDDTAGFHSRSYAFESANRLGLATDLVGSFAHGDYSQSGTDLRVERPRAAVTRTFARSWQASASAGPNVWNGGRGITPGIGLALGRNFGPESALGLSYDRYDLIDDVQTIASASPKVLQGDRVGLNGRHVFPGRVQLTGGATWAQYTDGNHATAASFALGRRVFRNPEIRLRADASVLSNTEQTDRYWSPNLYHSTGLGLLVLVPVGRYGTLVADGRLGWAIDSGIGALESGWGVRFQLAEVAGWSAELGYRNGTTNRAGSAFGSHYGSQTGTVGVRWRLGAP